MSSKNRSCACHVSASVWIAIAVAGVLCALSPAFFDKIWGRHK